MVDLARDESLRKTFSRAAREHIRQNFTLDHMTADYLSLFHPATVAVCKTPQNQRSGKKASDKFLGTDRRKGIVSG
jgi:hypothetical protein